MRSLVFIILACAGILVLALGSEHFAGVTLGWTGAILALTSIHFFVEPLRWQVYAGGGDKKRLSIFYHLFSSTAFLSYILPAKLGLPLRYWLIVKYQGMTPATAGIYMAIDSALSLCIWTAVSVTFGGTLVRWLFEKYLILPGANGMLLAAVLVVVAAILYIGLGAERRCRISRALTGAWSQIGVHHLVQASILFLADIGGYIIRHAAILAALSVPFIGWQAVATSTVLSIYAGFLCMLPMGLIGYDAVMVLLLTQYGVTVETAVLVPIINRSANLFIGVLLGVPSSLKLGIGLSRKSVTAMLGENRNEK